MNSEKVKEIKNNLNTEIKLAELNKTRFTELVSVDLIKDILTLINELESENERLLGVVKEKIHGIGEMCYTHAIEIKKLQDNNTEIKNAKDRLLEENKTLVWLNQNMCKENQQLKDRIAELEKGNEALSFAVNQGFNDCQTKTLKQFAERLKEEGLVIFMGDIIIRGSKIDEVLKEFINE